MLTRLNRSKTAGKGLPYAHFVTGKAQDAVELLGVIDIAEIAGHLTRKSPSAGAPVAESKAVRHFINSLPSGSNSWVSKHGSRCAKGPTQLRSSKANIERGLEFSQGDPDSSLVVLDFYFTLARKPSHSHRYHRFWSFNSLFQGAEAGLSIRSQEIPNQSGGFTDCF